MPDFERSEVIQAMVAGSSAATPHIASGKMKVLGINGPKRAKALPNVPTFAEAGYPNAEMYFYLGLTGPKGMPKAIIDQIASDTRKVLADQSFVEKTLDVFGFEPISETPEQFAEFLKRDRTMAEKKIRDAVRGPGRALYAGRSAGSGPDRARSGRP